MKLQVCFFQAEYFVYILNYFLIENVKLQVCCFQAEYFVHVFVCQYVHTCKVMYVTVFTRESKRFICEIICNNNAIQIMVRT